MSYYVTNENSFLDIKNAHLRVTGNVHTDVLKVGSIGFQPTGSNIPGTVNFTNVTTGVTTSSNLDVGGTLNLGTVELSASTHTLGHVTARGNVTSTTVQFDNATTGLVTTANVEVGGELTVSSNIEVAGFIGTSGTGALTVPSGTTGEQPTGVVGMIRYNSTLNKYEGRVSTIWMPMTGEPPLYEFISHTFTNAGQTGRTGPSLATLTGHSDYSSAAWRTDTNNFSLSSSRPGFQLWTIPATGNYRINARGAMGGHGDTANKNPGFGGIVQADFAFTKGTKIIIIVGQKGEDSGLTPNVGGAGGGATWVLDAAFNSGYSSDIYLIAGGGAGGHGYTGSISRTADANASSNGSSSNGGAAASTATYDPGGGAGYSGNGAGSSTSLPSGGRNPTNGATGGYGGYSNNESHHGRRGGFGGGGGNGAHSSGGGAGYGGGQAQYWGTNTVANGSTSYILPSGVKRLTGTAVFDGLHSANNGSVTITKL